jgi:DNA-binding transcriptional MocR family regulator
MSGKELKFGIVIDADIWKSAHLTANAKLLHGILRAHQGERDHSYASIRLMARELRISTATVQKCLKQLEKGQFIKVLLRGRSGKGESNWYSVDVSETATSTEKERGSFREGSPERPPGHVAESATEGITPEVTSVSENATPLSESDRALGLANIEAYRRSKSAASIPHARPHGVTDLPDPMKPSASPSATSTAGV